MNADDIRAIATLAWPALATVAFLSLLPTIIRIAKSRAFTIKVGEFELSVQDATNQLQRQIDDLRNQIGRVNGGAAVPAAVKSPGAPRLTEVLWVDDNPQNNAYEIARLRADGWNVVAVTSTQEALNRLTPNSALPSAVITDMGRKEGILHNARAGLELIRQVRSRGLDVPIYVYASAKAVDETRADVEQAGGNGASASPSELLSWLHRQ